MNGFLNKYSFNRILWLLVILMLCGCNGFKACVVQEFMQGRLADGVARLSILPISMIASELEDRFQGEDAKPEIVVKSFGDEYGRGEATFTLKDQIIDYPEETVLMTDCMGNKVTWQGKAHVISATMYMRGRLINQKNRPVMPDEDSIEIKVHAKVHNLAVQAKGKEGYLRLDEGDIKFTVKPRLAQSRKKDETEGFLAAKTMYARFDKVRLTEMKGMLISDQLIMPITIQDSFYYMQVGEGKNGESNVIKGTITMFNNRRLIPTDKKGLDPDYDKDRFFKTFSCWEEIAHKPLSFEYKPLEKIISGSMMGLTTLVLGAVVKKLEDDRVCGMKSEQVLRNVDINREPGKMGTATYKVRQCHINLDEFRVGPDCFGKYYVFSGNAQVISAQRQISGLIAASIQSNNQAVDDYLSGKLKEKDKPEAAIPGMLQPILITLNVDLKDVAVREECRPGKEQENTSTDNALHCLNMPKDSWKDFDQFKISRGQVEAELRPVLARQDDRNDEKSGLCAIETPISQVRLTLKKVQAELKAQGREIPLPLDGQVDFVNGKIYDRENSLRGKLSVGNMSIQFDKDGQDSELNINYKPEEFYARFASCKQITVPKTDADCRPERGLAANVARTLVPAAGAVVQALSPKKDFGIRSPQDFLKAKIREGGMTFTDERENVKINISDKDSPLFGTIGTIVKGSINVEMEGTEIKKKDLSDLGTFRMRVAPTRYDATVVDLNKVTVRDLRVRVDNEPLITFSGVINKLTARPIFGLHAKKTSKGQPIYSVETPITRIDDMELGPSSVTLQARGLSIIFKIRSARLNAFNGKFRGIGNYINGWITFDTEEGPLEVNIPELDLQPEYDQEKFDWDYFNKLNMEYLRDKNIEKKILESPVPWK